jgi:hypothetical protein
MTREIRADLNRRIARASAAQPIDDDTGQEARALALVDALFACARVELASLPHDEAVKALQDIGSGRAVIALYMADGKTKVKFNPPKEIESCFL